MDLKKRITKGMIQKMPEGNPVEVKGLVSKNARLYNARFVLDDI